MNGGYWEFVVHDYRGDLYLRKGRPYRSDDWISVEDLPIEILDVFMAKRKDRYRIPGAWGSSIEDFLNHPSVSLTSSFRSKIHVLVNIEDAL